MNPMFWVWLGITALALVLELSTMALTSIWFVGGGLIALILSCFDKIGWYWQALAFVVVSLALLFAIRPLVKQVFDKGSEGNTNTESYIGKEVRMLTSATFDTMGSAKLNDVVWSVISNDNTQLPEGSIVKIVSISGNKLVAELSDKETTTTT